MALPIPLSDITTLYYPAALAAYAPTPTLIVDDFKIVAPILVDQEKAKNIPPQHLPLLRSMLKLGPQFGFIAEKCGATLVAFRGTETAEEWLCDFDVKLDVLIHAGRIHEGFKAIYDCLLNTPLIPPTDALYVTGHSLGAALAIITADQSLSHADCRVCTFAGPRVGTEGFSNYYNEVIPNTVRVVNVWDIVPHVPLPPLYWHVGTELKINPGFSDIHKAHSLPLSYWPGLQELLQKT